MREHSKTAIALSGDIATSKTDESALAQIPAIDENAGIFAHAKVEVAVKRAVTVDYTTVLSIERGTYVDCCIHQTNLHYLDLSKSVLRLKAKIRCFDATAREKTYLMAISQVPIYSPIRLCDGFIHQTAMSPEISNNYP